MNYSKTGCRTIFICVPDIFKNGLAKYTFENLTLANN